MTRHTARTLLATGGLAVVTALVLTGCGQGFTDTPSESGSASELTSSDDGLTILIGSSGDAETTAVKDAVA